MTNTPTDSEIAEARKYYDWLIEPDPDGKVRINYTVRFLGKVLTRHDADQERIRELETMQESTAPLADDYFLMQAQLTAANERIRELEAENDKIRKAKRLQKKRGRLAERRMKKAEERLSASTHGAIYQKADELQAQLTQARLDLRKYGRHKDTCEKGRRHAITGEFMTDCTCGFDEALSD